MASIVNVSTNMESVDWVNDLITKMWPNIDQAAAKIARDDIEPQVKRLLPLLLRGIHFRRFSLGPKPIHIDAIQALRRTESSVVLLVDFSYDGEPDISISLRGIEIGVRHLQIKGRLSLDMAPMTSKIPIVGAIKAFFTNVPSIEFDLSGAAEITDLPFVHKALHQAVVQILSDRVVLPNMLVMKLNADAAGVQDIFSADYIAPRLLKLTIIEAQNVVNTQAHGLMALVPGVKTDPYVTIRLGTQVFNTTTKKNDLNPVWNDQRELFVHSDSQVMEVTVMDDDTLRSDKCIGKAHVAVADLCREADIWADLGQGSRIHLQGQLFDLHPDGPSLVAGMKGDVSRAVLSVMVEQARLMPTLGHHIAWVRATLGQKTQMTRHVPLFRQVKIPVEGSDTDFMTEERPHPNPEWEQVLEFTVEDHTGTSLTVEVLTDGNSIGEFSVPLSDLLQSDGLTIRRHFDLKHLEAYETSLLLTLRLFAVHPSGPEGLLTCSAEHRAAEDGTSLKWLSTMLETMWPFMKDSLHRNLEERVLPMMQKQSPVPLKCVKFDLGPSSPVMDNFRVTSIDKLNTNLFLTASHDSPCDVQFSVGSSTVHMKHLSFRGDNTIVMQPLLPHSPLVAAMQVYFADPPVLDMEFDGTSEWPEFTKTFREAVQSQIQQDWVLPNRHLVRVLSETPFMPIYWQLYQPPLGLLKVTVAEAADLKKVTTGEVSPDVVHEPSTYAVVALGSGAFTTPIIQSTPNPVWQGQTFEFLVSNEKQRLTVQLFDAAGHDALLSHCEMTAAYLVAHKDSWVASTQGSGHVRLCTKWMELKGSRSLLSAIPQVAEGPTALLTVLVDQAQRLPYHMLNEAQVEVVVGDCRKVTRSVPLVKSVMRADRAYPQIDCNPEWQEVLYFFVNQVNTLPVECNILGKTTAMHGFKYDAAHVLSAGQVDHGNLVVRRSFKLEGSPQPDSTLAVTFMLAALDEV